MRLTFNVPQVVAIATVTVFSRLLSSILSADNFVIIYTAVNLLVTLASYCVTGKYGKFTLFEHLLVKKLGKLIDQPKAY